MLNFAYRSGQLTRGVCLVCLMFGTYTAPAQQESSTQKPAEKEEPQSKSTDPFADLPAPSAPPETTEPPAHSWARRIFDENFGFRKEIMSQFDTGDGRGASRQSVGFEMLKKFSTKTSTIASFDFQGRLVRRDGFVPVLNDMEGEHRPGWTFEYHNLYVDFYNIFNPLLNEKQRSENVGRFNFRAGRFYVPFGLNLQTDTHGTVLQLSNDRNFGFERDWYTGFWGSLNSHLNYDLYYLTGSGYDIAYKGQSGLGALRISLSNKYSSRYGLEGGLSFIGGERLSPDAYERTHPAAMNTLNPPIETERVGVDGRYRRAVTAGLLTLTSELSGGRDVPDSVFTQLYQSEYLHRSRRWGVASQYRRFQQAGVGADSSIIGEFTWYFRNDVGNSNLHWIKLNVEQQLERMRGRPKATVVTLQYYFYR